MSDSVELLMDCLESMPPFEIAAAAFFSQTLDIKPEVTQDDANKFGSVIKGVWYELDMLKKFMDNKATWEVVDGKLVWTEIVDEEKNYKFADYRGAGG